MKQLSKCYKKLKDFDKAESYLLSALRARAKPDEILLKQGYQQFDKENFEAARMILYKAATANPKSILSWLGLGRACYKLGQFDDAANALKEANILDPQNSEVWCYLALVACVDKNRECEIVRILRELNKLDVDNFDLFFQVILLVSKKQVSTALRDANRPLDAINITQKIFNSLIGESHKKKDSDNDLKATLLFNLGDLHHTVHHFLDAKQFFLQAKDISDDEVLKKNIQRNLTMIEEEMK